MENKLVSMKLYKVNELATLSGVSVRTLHHYDKIDLLKPSERTEAGYRLYGEEELLRLQQILFYKELDFSLQKIKELLDDPDFDMINALEKHKAALHLRKKRISQLLITIDKTIHQFKAGKIMENPEMLYEGLPKEMGTQNRKEAIDTYGKIAIENSEQALLQLGKEGYTSLQKELEQIIQDLFAIRHFTPEKTEVQQLVASHYAVIRKFWGTSTKKDKQADAYAGLGHLYVMDERYLTVDGEAQPAFAQFLQQAMGYYADTQLT